MNQIIKDFYCNGFFGRRYDLSGAKIEAEGEDWIVIRLETNEPLFASFQCSQEKDEFISNWT